MLNRALRTASLLLSLGVVAHAEPFTSHFADVGGLVDERLAGLAEPATRPERRQTRALRGARAALDKPATDLKADLRTAGRVVKKLETVFPDDNEVAELLDALLGALDGDVRGRLAHVRTDLELSAPAKADPRTRAERQADRAADRLVLAGSAEGRRRAVRELRRALSRVRRAEHALEDLAIPSARDALRAQLTRIEHADLDESSGIVHVGGAFWTHNDSGRAALYRSSTLDFAEAEVLDVPGASNVDWEDIAEVDGDLVVCDVGDNLRRRDDLMAYRVRHVAAEQDAPARLDLVGAYPLAYPDGPHDVEAAFFSGGLLHLIVKNRGEATTAVFRFDALSDAGELGAGERNVAVHVADIQLPAGHLATAADVHASSGRLVVLTYVSVNVFDVTQLGAPPERSVPFFAFQAEALCFDGDRLVITNEQRGVYVAERFLDRR